MQIIKILKVRSPGFSIALTRALRFIFRSHTPRVQLFMQVPKLLRLGRLFKFLTRFEGAANIGRIVMLMFLFILLLHWMTCVFYLITNYVEYQGEVTQDYVTHFLPYPFVACHSLSHSLI